MKNRLTTLRLFTIVCSLLVLIAPTMLEASACGTAAPATSSSLEADAASIPSATSEIIIHAPKERVWQAIRIRRTMCANRKLLSHTEKEATMQEFFTGCPIVGDVTCTYVEEETRPLERMDYHMIESNRLRTFEGAYVLRTADDGSSTVLQLTSVIDPGIRVPFWQDISRAQAARSVREILGQIAAIAEHNH